MRDSLVILIILAASAAALMGWNWLIVHGVIGPMVNGESFGPAPH